MINALKNPLSLLDDTWHDYFTRQLNQPYMVNLFDYVEQQYAAGTVYPPKEEIWNAFTLTPLSKIRVVIIGQDPYHGPGQAHGLSFSVKDNVKMPPSLKNMFKELNRDLNIPIPDNGNLQCWARQGVLLLNSCLSVNQGAPASHAKQGWETFTQRCIDYINDTQTNVVFLAWGRFAHKVCDGVDSSKHNVIKTSHPSPLGATKQGKTFEAFLGSGCFSQANQYLSNHGLSIIDWTLPVSEKNNLAFDF